MIIYDIIIKYLIRNEKNVLYFLGIQIYYNKMLIFLKYSNTDVLMIS